MPEFPIGRRLASGDDALTAPEMNLLLDYVEQIGSTPPSLGESLGTGEGGQPVDLRPQPVWAQLLGPKAGNKYAWRAIYPLADGTNPLQADDIYVPRGTVTTWPAVEVNGRTDVTGGYYYTGPKVLLFPSPNGPWMLFAAPRAGDGAGDGGGGPPVTWSHTTYVCVNGVPTAVTTSYRLTLADGQLQMVVT